MPEWPANLCFVRIFGPSLWCLQERAPHQATRSASELERETRPDVVAVIVEQRHIRFRPRVGIGDARHVFPDLHLVVLNGEGEAGGDGQGCLGEVSGNL